MEQLEPIIRNRFWILLGIALLMTGIGWWMGTGEIQSATATRIGEIEAAEKKIPTGEVPNSDWAAQLSKINAVQEASVNSTRQTLWENQRASMWWNESIQPFVNNIPYRGTIDVRGLDSYRTYYFYDVQRVHKLANPFDSLDGSGVVLYPIERMPQRMFGNQPPSPKDVWDAQEDLWLLEPLHLAIRAMNGGENGTRADATVYAVQRLELMGGEHAQGEGGESADGGGGVSDPMAAFYAGRMGPGGGGGGGAGGAGGAAASAASAEFDPKEEFGSSGMAGSAGGGGGGYPGSGAMPASLGVGGPTDGELTENVIRRYVDDEESLPFKTRAFYLSVVMDHRQVPRFIAELTSSDRTPYPIEIVRVQMRRTNEDSVEGSRGGGMSFGGAGGMGSPAGGHGGAGGPPVSPGPMPFEGGGGASPAANFPGNFGGGAASANGTGLEAALADPFTANVAIAGLITLYQPPPQSPDAVSAENEDSASSAAEAGASETSGEASEQPAEGTPSATPSTDGTTPATAGSPATEPAPAEPTDGAAAGSDPSMTPATDETSAPGEAGVQGAGTNPGEATTPADPAPADSSAADPDAADAAPAEPAPTAPAATPEAATSTEPAPSAAAPPASPPASGGE